MGKCVICHLGDGGGSEVVDDGGYFGGGERECYFEGGEVEVGEGHEPEVWRGLVTRFGISNMSYRR